MNISKKSWHYRFNSWVSWDESETKCEYIWRTTYRLFFTILGSLLLLLAFYSAGFMVAEFLAKVSPYLTIKLFLVKQFPLQHLFAVIGLTIFGIILSGLFTVLVWKIMNTFSNYKPKSKKSKCERLNYID